MPRRLFIVEDHDWAREALAKLLDLEPDLEVCGTARSAEEALETLPGGCDLVLVDLHMGGMSGLDLVRLVKERWPDMICLVLSGHPAAHYASAARAAGSIGFVEKGNAPALLEAIRNAWGNGSADADSATDV